MLKIKTFKTFTIIAGILIVCSLTQAAESKKTFFEGYNLLQKGEIAKAIIFFKQALQEAPNHAPTYSKLADCYERLGKYKDAAPLWRKYVELRPRLAKHIRKHVKLLDRMELAESKLAILKASESVYESNSVKSSQPELSEPTTSRAKVTWVEVESLLLDVSQDTYSGSCIAEKAINILIPRLVAAKKYQESLKLVRRLVREYPRSMTAQMHLYWGISLKGTADFFQAITVLQKAEALFAGLPLKQKACRRQAALSLMEYGRKLLLAGSYMSARTAFKSLRGSYLSSLQPEETLLAQKYMLAAEEAHVAEWVKQGDVYASQGMFEDAIRWYAKVRTLIFSNVVTMQAEKRIRKIENMGQKNLKEIDDLIAKGKFGSAMVLAESIEKRYSDKFKIKAMEKFAEAAVISKQYNLSVQKLFSIAEKFHTKREGVFAYAKVGYLYGITLKTPKKGLTLFQQMLKWQPNDSRVQTEGQLGIGIMLAILGKKEEAIKVLTAVAVANKDNKRITEICKQYIWKCKNCDELSL